MTSAELLWELREAIWIADAHRDDGKQFIVHANVKVTGFLELERAICLRLLSENLEN